MLDLVAEAIFDPDRFTFHAAEKEAVLPAFLAPSEEDDRTPVNWTPEDADAALRFLIEENMVVMDGNLISIHPRFLDVLAGSPALVDANKGQNLTSSPIYGRMIRPVRWRGPRNRSPC